MQRQIEETFNRALADGLQFANQHWGDGVCRTETIGLIEGNPQLKPDILIREDDAPPVAIECSYDAADASQDAARRLGLLLARDGREITASIAIAIPQGFRQSQQADAAQRLLNGEVFGMALYQSGPNGPERFPVGGFIRADLGTLSDMTAVVAASTDRCVQVAREVSLRLSQSVTFLAQIPEGSRQQIATTMQHNVLNGLQVVALMWMNALLVQNQLHRQRRHGVRPVIFDPAKQPVSTEYLTQWRRILRTNWRAIFQPAITAMEIAVNYESVMRSAMERLIVAVQRIETARLGRHI